jgi:GNAT superfamily N-acetyltransferase
MSEELQITFEPDNESAKVFVTNSLDNHNIAATGHSAYYPVAYFLKSHEGEVLGGLLGLIWGGWLHIKYVWVAEPVRGKGYARRLVATAEAYAKKRGCRGVFLETFSFQAKPLYEKLGFSVFGQIDDYPPGHTQYFLSKRF